MSEEAERNPEIFPEQQAEILLSGPAGDLEAITDVPDEADIGVVAIICHSLSDDGGTLHSKVVQMIERATREMGARTVRFNSRGVGGSQGHHSDGHGEAEDLLAVAEWVRRVRPDDELWLGGYSSGSYVTAMAAQKIPLTHLISVAPPVEDFDFKALPRPEAHWLVIQGDADEWVNPDAVYSWVQDMDEPPQLVAMENADHQFHRRLMDLRGVIKNGIRRQEKISEDAGDP
ncbi:MAG: alpha/beta fold hydrolase [Xanthomonadales bacterium]|nr:alpha/beta fold hydrolase [Xanthomonadales bacterium]